MRSVFARALTALTFVAVVGAGAVGCGSGGGGGGGGFVGSNAVDANKSTVAATTATVKADGTSTGTVTVVVKDSNGNAIKNAFVTANVSGTNNLVNVAGPTDTTGTTMITVASTKAETKTITVSAVSGINAAVTLAQTAKLTFVAIPASNAGTTISSSSTSVTADGTSNAVVTVTARDSLGNPIQGQTVTFTTTGTNVTIAGVSTSAVTDASGNASTTITSTTAQQNVVVTATITSSAGGATVTISSPAITFVAGPATQLSFTSLPTFTAGVPNTIVVCFFDAHSNLTPVNQEVVLNIPVTGNNPAYNLPLIGPSTKFSTGNTIVVAQGGIAQFSGLILQAAGGYTVGAQATGFAAIGGNFSVVGNTAVSLAFRSGPSGAADNVSNMPSTLVTASTFNPVVKVFAQDVFGNNTATLPFNVGNVVITSTGGAITLTGNAPQALVNGVATFAGLGTSSGVTANSTLTASDANAVLTAATSNPFGVVLAAKAAAIRITQVTNATTSLTTLTAGQASSTLTASVVDSLGNTATTTNALAITVISRNAFGVTATVATPTIGAGASSTTFTITQNLVGTYTLFTTNTGDGGKQILNFVTTAAPTTTPAGAGITTAWSVGPDLLSNAHSLIFTHVPGCGYAVGTFIPNTGVTVNSAAGVITSPAPNVQVTARDQFGNVATNYSGTVTLTLGNGGGTGTATLAAATTAVAVNGVANFPPLAFVSGNTPAGSLNYTITATGTGAPAPTATGPITFNVIAAGQNTANAAKLVFRSLLANAVAGDAITAISSNATDIVVEIQDFYGTQILGDAGPVVVINSLAGTGIGTQAGASDLAPAVGPFTAPAITAGAIQPSDAHFQAQYVHQNATCITLQFVASTAGLNNACSNAIDILPGAAETVALVQGPQPNPPAPLALHVTGNLNFPTIIGTAGSGFGLPYLHVLDAKGNVATTFGGSASASLTQAGLPVGFGVLNGTLAVGFVSGNAIFTNLGITGQATPTTLTYTNGLTYAVTGVPGYNPASIATNSITVTAP